MKNKSASAQFMRIAVKKPLLFYSFLALGITVFLYLTLSTRIETSEGTKTLLWMIFVKAGRGL
jgi:hypothetical protein